MQQRLPSLLRPPIAFAHRGARAHAPENTLEAFALALRLGATGLETDAWRTADGAVVLDHDGVVRVGRRKRAIGEVARRDLPAHIPSIEDLLERCGAGYQLSVDLKDPAAGEPLVRAVRELAPDLLPGLWLCSPSHEVLADLRPLDPDVRLVDSTRLRAMREGPERRAATLAARGIDAVNLHHTDWSGGLVALFHRFDRFALAWDLQFPEALRPVLRMGVDGVFSDWVDRMVDAFTAEGLR